MDDVVLKDEWSPYNNFTIVPYFPYFMYGQASAWSRTCWAAGAAEQGHESGAARHQHHTANSGWKVKSGALTNMTVEELEQRAP